MPNPVIEISYYNEPPRIKLPSELEGKVDIRLIDITDEDTLVLRYKGVEIHQTVKDWRTRDLSDCWYSNMPNTDHEAEDTFDVRDLPDVPEGHVFEEHHLADQWNTEQMQLAYAIEKGWITEDEIKIPKNA